MFGWSNPPCDHRAELDEIRTAVRELALIGKALSEQLSAYVLSQAQFDEQTRERERIIADAMLEQGKALDTNHKTLATILDTLERHSAQIQSHEAKLCQ